ncbi:MAG: hypothetical protein WA989_02320 [Henriciella sp.]|uniref:hypothetical protein n=1 Tax=Henriciella sp. TaxID=1968823 RepID=UPI003C76931E
MYHYRRLVPDDISARALILSLLSTVDVDRQAIGALVNAGDLFGIEPVTIRVAATRLVKSGLLESPERGIYAPGPKAKALTRRLQQWRDVSDRLSDWTGSWLVCLTHHLGRADRKKLRERERALMLYGYRETPNGLWVRPANISRTIDELRDELVSIGAGDGIMLMEASDFATGLAKHWESLWSAKELHASYTAAIADMTSSLPRLATLPPDEAARESLLIGQAVIRTINFDPLLPPELADQGLFLQMVETMKRYNETGIACWDKYHASMNLGA